MACPTIISIDHFSRYTPQQIGSMAATFEELVLAGVPVPEMVVVPRETLSRLAQDTGLTAALKKYQSEAAEHPTALSSKIAHFTEHVQLPDWFTNQVLQIYHLLFPTGFVRIIPGEHQLSAHLPVFESIQGDANVLESLRAAWGATVQHSLRAGAAAPHHLAGQVPLIIQAQGQPAVSGTATSFGANGSAGSVTVRAIWGMPHQQLLRQAADSFTINTSTGTVIERTIVHKPHQYHRHDDGSQVCSVPTAYQNAPTLSDQQCVVIAGLVQRIKRQHMNHQEVSWELTDEGLVITSCTSVTLPEPTHKPRKTQAMTTQLLVSAGNPFKRQAQLSAAVDGIGILRSEYTLISFGIHPHQLAQTSQKRTLTKELTRTITAYQEALPGKPILYRLQNCTSAELAKLRFGQSYEPEEANPYLGSRGAGRYMHMPTVFEIEAQAVKDALVASKNPLGLVIPFARDPSELQYVLERLTSWEFFRYPHFQVWMQLNTPANILNLRQYPLEKLTGLSLNVTSLEALTMGFDPDNPELAERYRGDTAAVETLMELAAQHAHTVRSTRVPQLQLNIHIESYSEHLVAKAVELGYHGVVVKPQAVPVAREAILAAEEKKVLWQ